MQLLNVSAAAGVWTQVYDGTAVSVIAVTGNENCQVCQSTTPPATNLIGIPLIGGSPTQNLFRAVSGTPVYVKPLNAAVTVIVNA